MKKIVMIVGGVIILLALIWGGVKFFGNAPEEDAAAETDVSSGNAETDMSESTGVPQNDQADSETSVSTAEGSVSGSDVPAAEESVSGSDVSTAEEETAAEDGEDEFLAEETAFSEEGVLYTINTSAGSNLGMVPIVNGSAVVLMDGGSGTTYQGEYVPEEQSAFQSKEEEIAALASSTGKIEAGAFYREAMMKEFTFPDGVTSVEKFAFARSGLQKVVIPDGVTSIGYGAFYHCDSLADVVIPDSVASIEENAFSHTAWLDSWLAAGSQDTSGAEDFLIVGDGILLAYRGKDANPELPAEVKSVVPGVLEN